MSENDYANISRFGLIYAISEKKMRIFLVVFIQCMTKELKAQFVVHKSCIHLYSGAYTYLLTWILLGFF